MPTPRPDKPPAGFKPRKRPTPAMKPTGYTTVQAPDGSWILKPTGFKPGKEDVALRPRIEITPIQRRVQSITRRHQTQGD